MDYSKDDELEYIIRHRTNTSTELDKWIPGCEWCDSKGIKNEDDWVQYFKDKQNGVGDAATNSIRTMPSKYNGTCKKCSGSIKVGDMIAWSRETGAMHESCCEVSGCEFKGACNAEGCWVKDRI